MTLARLSVSASSKSQTGVEHLTDVIMISDAGAYDMGFIGGPGATTSFTNGGTGTANGTAVPSFTGYTPGPWTGTKVYAGPWGRKNVSGAWGGGKSAASGYQTGQRGQVTSCFVDGHAASQDISKTYELRSIDGTNNAAYRLYSGSTQ